MRQNIPWQRENTYRIWKKSDGYYQYNQMLMIVKKVKIPQTGDSSIFHGVLYYGRITLDLFVA